MNRRQFIISLVSVGISVSTIGYLLSKIENVSLPEELKSGGEKEMKDKYYDLMVECVKDSRDIMKDANAGSPAFGYYKEVLVPLFYARAGLCIITSTES